MREKALSALANKPSKNKSAGQRARSQGKRIIKQAKEESFTQYCKKAGLPAPVAEHRFHDVRKWRFDYAWIEQKVALEIEGGIWTQGRHTRGAGFQGDMQKYNAATALGWRIIRTTPANQYGAELLRTLQEVLV